MKKLTREQFNNLPSGWNKELCPDCGTGKTRPRPNCDCRGMTGMARKPHIMKEHHSCPQE